MRSPLPLLAGVCLVAAALSPTTSFAGTGKQLSSSAKSPVSLAPVAAPHGFFVRAGGGVEYPVSGEFTPGLRNLVWAGALGLPAGRGAFDLDFNSLDYDDIYDEMYGGNVEIGYDLAKRLAMYVGVGYLSGEANRVGIGTINGRAAYAEFDDYEAWRLYGGLRHILGKGRGPLTPYIGAHAGVSFVEGIAGSYSSAGRHGVSTPKISLYDDSEVFFGGFTLGLAYEIARNFSVGIETGLNYQGALDGSSFGSGSNAQEPGLEALGNGEGFWSIPVRVFGELTFKVDEAQGRAGARSPPARPFFCLLVTGGPGAGLPEVPDEVEDGSHVRAAVVVTADAVARMHTVLPAVVGGMAAGVRLAHPSVDGIPAAVAPHDLVARMDVVAAATAAINDAAVVLVVLTLLGKEGALSASPGLRVDGEGRQGEDGNGNAEDDREKTSLQSGRRFRCVCF